VEYAKLVSPLIEAVKILKDRNQELDAKVESLLSENETLRDSLNKILVRLDALEQ
jgi:hypothetical protein